MLTPTDSQKDQIDGFFYLIRDNYKNILLHPIIDEKTGTERLGLCVAIRNGKDDNDIYLLGLLFLSEDKLFDRFSFKKPEERIITTMPNRFTQWLKRMMRVILLWNN